jgi:hypothetical protein
MRNKANSEVLGAEEQRAKMKQSQFAVEDRRLRRRRAGAVASPIELLWKRAAPVGVRLRVAGNGRGGERL